MCWFERGSAVTLHFSAADGRKGCRHDRKYVDAIKTCDLWTIGSVLVDKIMTEAWVWFLFKPVSHLWMWNAVYFAGVLNLYLIHSTSIKSRFRSSSLWSLVCFLCLNGNHYHVAPIKCSMTSLYRCLLWGTGKENSDDTCDSTEYYENRDM